MGVGLGGISDTEREWENIVEYARKRPQVIVEELQEELGYGEAFMLDFAAEEGTYYLGNVLVGDSFHGTWLDGSGIEIYGKLIGGLQIEGYLVNGVFWEGDYLKIKPSEVSGWKDGIHIEPVLIETEIERLEIVMYQIDGTEDFVVLQNTGSTMINLAEYSITDNKEETSKGRLPEIVLQPEEQFVIYGSKYTGSQEENSIQVPFSWNSDESIYLYHQVRGLIE